VQPAHFETQAKNIGHIALQLLAVDHQVASVFGVTSRGLFIRLEAVRWLIFLSYEKYRSPLTVALNQTVSQLRLVEPGSPVLIQSGKLLFPLANVTVSLVQTKAWRPDDGAPDKVQPPAGRWACLQAVVKTAIAAKNGHGFSPLLPFLIDRPVQKTLSAEQWQVLGHLRQAQQAFRNENIAAALENLGKLLGWGQGLTPSGDDVVLGLLFLFNRWPAIHHLGKHLPQLNHQVTRMAYEKTTTLSANLIECAALGESDERLINVADCIVLGKPPETECLPALLGWGASSGVDVLAGLATVLTL
jgi:hypothetical protein